jgi:hypothetical protein
VTSFLLPQFLGNGQGDVVCGQCRVGYSGDVGVCVTDRDILWMWTELPEGLLVVGNEQEA